MSAMAEEARYGIEELAARGGVTRRTVRYYVQQGLLPAPLGVGRGRHYGPRHLERLLAVKALQESGLSLDEVRRELERRAGRRAAGAAAAMELAHGAVPATPVTSTAWRRIELVPGVEMHVRSDRHQLSPARLRELVEWCERHLDG
jgi:DNA-binding transcriptional MerR regulator